ncbi:hypothetical protein ANK1_2693 [plant metagenome]|uniref:Uncharacterized protein n=1 Tax=plant metagenome TaxID=1297885 RepID=A0A484PJL4_9ZZZZ
MAAQGVPSQHDVQDGAQMRVALHQPQRRGSGTLRHARLELGELER